MKVATSIHSEFHVLRVALAGGGRETFYQINIKNIQWEHTGAMRKIQSNFSMRIPYQHLESQNAPRLEYSELSERSNFSTRMIVVQVLYIVRAKQ